MVPLLTLETPPEPEDLRNLISEVIKSGLSPKYALWLGNKLPKYLWRYWGVELKREGVKWQDFLKLLSSLSEDVMAWASGNMEWSELIRRIKKSLKPALQAPSAGLNKWFRDF